MRNRILVFVCGLAGALPIFSGPAWGQSCPESLSCSSSSPALSASNSGSGEGIYGSSSSAYGVHGVGGASGVYGESTNTGAGVYGFGAATPGVRGEGYYGYGVYAHSAFYAAVYANGDIYATGTKSFVEPHPSDPTRVIRYVSLEGREAGTYFRGTGRTVLGKCVIEVPEDFRIVTDASGLTVQLTPIGSLATMAVVSEGLERIVVRSSRDVAFHYQINGVRKAFKDRQPVTFGTDFVPASGTAHIPESLPSEIRQRLVQNGTYREDGTVNSDTALRLGWNRLWTGKAILDLASLTQRPEERAERQVEQSTGSGLRPEASFQLAR